MLHCGLGMLRLDSISTTKVSVALYVFDYKLRLFFYFDCNPTLQEQSGEEMSDEML